MGCELCNKTVTIGAVILQVLTTSQIQCGDCNNLFHRIVMGHVVVVMDCGQSLALSSHRQQRNTSLIVMDVVVVVVIVFLQPSSRFVVIIIVAIGVYVVTQDFNKVAPGHRVENLMFHIIHFHDQPFHPFVGK